MSDILLDLVSEEIPARMQIELRDLARLLEDALVEANVWTKNSNVKTFCGPRHLVAYVTNVLTKQADRIIENVVLEWGHLKAQCWGF